MFSDDLGTAYKAASMMKITYKNVQKPIVDIDEAIDKGDFHAEETPYVMGDPESKYYNNYIYMARINYV